MLDRVSGVWAATFIDDAKFRNSLEGKAYCRAVCLGPAVFQRATPCVIFPSKLCVYLAQFISNEPVHWSYVFEPLSCRSEHLFNVCPLFLRPPLSSPQP